MNLLLEGEKNFWKSYRHFDDRIARLSFSVISFQDVADYNNPTIIVSDHFNFFFQISKNQ